MRQEEEAGRCEPDGEDGRGFIPLRFCLDFGIHPHGDQVRGGDVFVPSAHLDMISSNCFVIITSVNHAPPFWGEKLRGSHPPLPDHPNLNGCSHPFARNLWSAHPPRYD